MSGGEVLVVVRCARCRTEGRREHPRIGELRTVGRRINWYAADKRWRRAVRQQVAGGDEAQMRWRAARAVTVDGESLGLADDLPAYCARHGAGVVATADVLAARGETYLELAAKR